MKKEITNTKNQNKHSSSLKKASAIIKLKRYVNTEKNPYIGNDNIHIYHGNVIKNLSTTKYTNETANQNVILPI